MTYPHVWIITDGKAGDLNPCLAVARAAHWQPEVWRVESGGLWNQFMGPYRIIRDNSENPEVGKTETTQAFSLSLRHFYSSFSSSWDWPEVLIASGRRTIPIVRLIRKLAKGRTFTVFLKDPRTFRSLAHFTWVFEHDSLRGKGVYATLTTPHGLSPSLLSELRIYAPESLLLPKPRVAVLVGGNSRHHVFTQADQERFIIQLKALIDQGYHLMITPSRRTPEPLKKKLLDLASETQCRVWDGAQPNPYATFLALADYVVVTTDSMNMMGEALATGLPLLLFEPQGGHQKITQFTRILKEKGYASVFQGSISGTPYPPIDSTSEIANRMLEAFSQWKKFENSSRNNVKG
jgi:mitochondrial fission protein ELM1